MPPDENPRSVALDFQLDRLRVDFDLPHFRLLAHLLEDLLEDLDRLEPLLLDSDALAPGRAAVVVTRRRRLILPRRIWVCVAVSAAAAAPAPRILAPAAAPLMWLLGMGLRVLPATFRRATIDIALRREVARRRRDIALYLWRFFFRGHALARNSHSRLARAQSEHARAVASTSTSTSSLRAPSCTSASSTASSTDSPDVSIELLMSPACIV